MAESKKPRLFNDILLRLCTPLIGRGVTLPQFATPSPRSTASSPQHLLSHSVITINNWLVHWTPPAERTGAIIMQVTIYYIFIDIYIHIYISLLRSYGFTCLFCYCFLDQRQGICWSLQKNSRLFCITLSRWIAERL